jgi:hypothetical protein
MHWVPPFCKDGTLLSCARDKILQEMEKGFKTSCKYIGRMNSTFPRN